MLWSTVTATSPVLVETKVSVMSVQEREDGEISKRSRRERGSLTRDDPWRWREREMLWM
jgi:hypothetical protein